MIQNKGDVLFIAVQYHSLFCLIQSSMVLAVNIVFVCGLYKVLSNLIIFPLQPSNN